MEKEEKPIFLRALLIVFVFLFVNLGVYVYQHPLIRQSGGLTGFSVSSLKTTISNSPPMQTLPKIFLIVQWSLLSLMLFYSFFKDLTSLKKQREVKSVHPLKVSGKNKTDLDVLYDLLKPKNKLRVSTIAKTFKIENDVAMEWCRILESGDLATINYPGFGEPVIQLKVEKPKVEEDKLGDKNRLQEKGKIKGGKEKVNENVSGEEPKKEIETIKNELNKKSVKKVRSNLKVANVKSVKKSKIEKNKSLKGLKDKVFLKKK